MKFLTLLAATIVGLVSPALAAPEVGKAAPNFSAKDTNGNAVSLSGLKGKTVVLEWSNHKCPFVVKHYKSNNMQKLQKQTKADGVVWITVLSSAEGKQGHVSAEEANKLTTDRAAEPAHVILDPEGSIGRMYNAKTTPHMYVIDDKGVLAYMGAIDDNSSADPADAATAKNYVTAALASLKAGEPVATATTTSYGCSVKY
ncbi:MAG: redoxin family protein [Rickettsiales bacterium]|nr:redoxin family protein [Rickettsiales bacterium]